MISVCGLAGIDPSLVSTFIAVLRGAGVFTSPTVVNLRVLELGKLRPDLLICDVDNLEVDALELLRRIRFVLPDCIIAVYTGTGERTWGLACHVSGVNCVLSKSTGEAALAQGIRSALLSGCYTDPAIAVADIVPR